MSDPKKFYIKTNEVWHCTYEVEANSKDEALAIFNDGKGVAVDEAVFETFLDSSDFDVVEAE